MGSVKDLQVLKKPEEKKAGKGRFVFSDRYSVFDWGEMPDHIPNKGAALCLMGAYCLEQVEKKEVKTHYRGLINEKGERVKTHQLKKPTAIMEVDLVRVFKPPFKKGSYDYSTYSADLVNFLLPLEVIYRNGLPKGSSVFKRLEKGSLKVKDLGLKKMPFPGQRFKKPFFDLSTKLEEKDRYLSWQEAKEISRLKDLEIKKIKDILSLVNKEISRIALKGQLVNEDGKIELAFDSERKLMLVDVIGTLDECRFTYQGQPISKEMVRQFYRKTDWYQNVVRAKETASQKGIKDWKKICSSQPTKLDKELKKIFSQVYQATANAFLEKDIFSVPQLAEVIKKYTFWLEKNK